MKDDQLNNRSGKGFAAMLKRGFFLFGLLLTVSLPLVGQTTVLDTNTKDTEYVTMFQFSPDGKSVVTYKTDGTLLWWDLESRKLIRSQPTEAGRPAFDPQGRLLSLDRGEDGTRLIDLVTKQEVKFLDGASFYSTDKFAISPDGKVLAVAERGVDLSLWDLTTGKEKLSIKRPSDPNNSGPDDYLNELIFSQDGTTLAGLSRSITLWSTATGKQSQSIAINAGLTRMNFNSDGKMICVSGFDNIKPSFVKCFGASSGREVLSVPADPSSPFALSPDGKVLALNRRGEGIFLISTATGKEVGKITLSADNSLTQMSFSPDGKLLAVGTIRGLVVLDPATRKELFVLRKD